jgi:hypothetical protein
VRIVDERPDLVFAGLGEGAWVSSRCPGRTPRRATATDAFRIAYENALLVDETFLAATESWAMTNATPKPGSVPNGAARAVRAALGLPPLDYGKSLDIAALAKAHGFDPGL